jgi:sensor c-di-GMP phosphodiesterase-like protein
MLGAIAGFWLGRAALLRTAKAGLADYGKALTVRADELSTELGLLFRRTNHSQFSYCSDQELASLQALTFASRDIKDIGRTHNGELYCSAFLGRLAHPYVEGQPTMTLADGTHVYTDVAVVLASIDRAKATIVESGDADVVLSPAAFDFANRPHVGYMVAWTNRKTGEIVPIAGQKAILDPAWAATQGFRIVGGLLYHTQCSATSVACAVTWQELTDLWSGSKASQIGYSVLGAAVGFGLGLTLGFWYARVTSLKSQLRNAIRIDSKALYVEYQPIIDLSSRCCAGCEALLRWRDRDGISVAPDVFVKLAEDAGFIGELTELVLRRSIRELGPHLRHHPEQTLAINVAASDLQGVQLAELLGEHVAEAGIHPHQIILELTERSTADLQRVRNSLEQLSSKGYKVHVDDFGTGFSSLSYLNELAVHAIKVDRSFTNTIGTSTASASILPQILAMADSLNVEVIVEGVETQGQLDYLESTDRSIRAQGWYFGRSMSAEQFFEFVEESEAEAAVNVRKVASF